MRSMQDAAYVTGFKPGSSAYAGYSLSDTGQGHDSYAGMVAMFPACLHLEIVTRFNAAGRCLDWETITTGTTTADAVAAVEWVQRRRAAGIIPWIYVQESLWTFLAQHFLAMGEPEPLWWVAHWTNLPHLETGAVATQWGGAPGVDYSVLADYIPGFDPPPIPPPSESEIDMFVTMTLFPDGSEEGWLVTGTGRASLDGASFNALIAGPEPLGRHDITYAVLSQFPTLTPEPLIPTGELAGTFTITGSGTIKGDTVSSDTPAATIVASSPATS